jgi:hypothetical protein
VRRDDESIHEGKRSVDAWLRELLREEKSKQGNDGKANSNNDGGRENS